MAEVSSLRRQDIISHDIDYVEYIGPGLTWGRIFRTCVKSMWRNDIKCKYMFMFPQKNLARKGLIFITDKIQWMPTSYGVHRVLCNKMCLFSRHIETKCKLSFTHYGFGLNGWYLKRNINACRVINEMIPTIKTVLLNEIKINRYYVLCGIAGHWEIAALFTTMLGAVSTEWRWQQSYLE